MSCRDKLVRSGLIGAAALAGATAVWACGPFFPDWLVTGEDRVLATPATWFRDAVESIVIHTRRPIKNDFHAVVDEERSLFRQTADADLADVEAATAEISLTARFAEVRGALRQYAEARAAWRQEAALSDQAPPEPEAPKLEAPAGLPGELTDYLTGAIAYHRGALTRARAAWEKVLDRPPAERRHRSTWAAFMLGKISLTKDPEAAIGWFERTRELAAAGFSDPLGLAASSFGWQARAELNRKHTVEALKLYFLQLKTGDPSALSSLRFAAAKTLKDPPALKEAAESEEARPIITAYLISRWSRSDGGALDAEPARKWLAAIRQAEVQFVPFGDRLAWLAYRAGDFETAEEWLHKSPGDKAMTYWIRAKLQMRAGDLAEAERLLRSAAHWLQADPGDHDPFEAYEAGVPFALLPRSEGERGAVQLAQGDYIGALNALVNGGYWTDAAYVAERVLTSDELRAHLDVSWPSALAAHRPEDYGDGWSLLYGGLVTPSKERMAYKLRYLLGRRLVREERYKEAQAYLPTSLGLPLKTLASSLADGRDKARPAEERARALFHAACIARHRGLELLGTELEPDWFIDEGAYEHDSFAKARTSGAYRKLGPTADERKRAGRPPATPLKRFHYRYRGADLARAAADLLPDGSPEKARILVTAGNWLEGRDPEAAKPFYEALLSCCGDTGLGQRAQRVKAIPNVPDACPADTRVQGEEER